VLAAALTLFASVSSAQTAAWSPQPWLEDLAQMRRVLDERYANLDWLREEREFDVDSLFARASAALGSAHSDEEARAVLNRVVERIADGHVDLRWPAPATAASATASTPAAAPASPDAAAFCRALGYDARQASAGIAPALAGYRPLSGRNLFPAGTIQVGHQRAGVIRIGVFQPQAYPAACEEAVASLRIPLDRGCDQACEDAILTAAYRRLTRDLEAQLTTLRRAGAVALLVDIADNGGGSEWAEAAARTMSARPLLSARRGFVRGSHWARQWRDLAATLREAAVTAAPADHVRLLGWAAEADAARRDAETPCPPGRPRCARLATAGYATGLVGSAPAGAFRGRAWAAEVFSPAQYDYHDGIWAGPLIVLVDGETWSAAEEFAALLQDNRAAIVIGARTGGAGCGHTNGGTPVTLTHSGAVLGVPDCVRFRRDGSNEVRGILPDLPLPIRANDGPHFRARLIQAALPDALTRARRLSAQRAR
jgi:hypothetical protein